MMKVDASVGEGKDGADCPLPSTPVTVGQTAGGDGNLVPKKTPVSVMSSSLKERLKKCGRYHPATPPSSRQSTPFTSQQNTPVASQQNTPHSSHNRTAEPLLQSTPILNQQGTPVLGQQKHSDQTSGRLSGGLKRKLPHPRNILAEASYMCKHSVESLNISDSLVETTAVSGGVCVHGTLSSKESEDRDSVCIANANCTQNQKNQKNGENVCDALGNEFHQRTEEDSVEKRQKTSGGSPWSTPNKSSSNADRKQESVSRASIGDLSTSSSAEHSSSIVLQQTSHSRLGNSSASSNASNKQILPVSEDTGSPEDSVSHSTSHTHSGGNTKPRKSGVLENSEELVGCKKQLKAKLTERGEVLRKLSMVKTYRAKNDLHHLQGLIDKWRSVCQEAVLDLHQLTPDPRPSLTQLVQQLGIDRELVCYDDVEECFDAT
ncbi:serine-rich adhesin for platelets-like [Littorina saxatilis]|uniref:Swi5-dependent recombination DNA repair protein 1 homolog n=1 Tax=Littorina saxatilis TaxID=31220 RepID=A0AAN9GLA5_9CAEN